MSKNGLSLGSEQFRIIDRMIHADVDAKKRIIFPKTKHTELPNHLSSKNLWVTMRFFKKLKISQTRDMRDALGKSKGLVINDQALYLNQKQAMNKLAGRKYETAKSRVYSIKADAGTYKKLFLYYYRIDKAWEFLGSNYAGFLAWCVPLEKWYNLKPYLGEDFLKNKKYKSGLELLKAHHYIPPSFLHIIYTNPSTIENSWKTYFKLYKNKCFSLKTSSVLAVLKIYESFWTYELFRSPMGEDDDPKNIRGICKLMLKLTNKIAEHIQDYSKPLKNSEEKPSKALNK
jgi:hypothetical protein